VRAAVLVFLLACGGKSAENAGPTCAQVMDHILELTKNQLVGHGDEVKSERAAMVKQCEDRNMPAEARKCLFEAKTLDDISKCRTASGPAEKQRKPLPNRGSN
jgi:hypothetical protein